MAGPDAIQHTWSVIKALGKNASLKKLFPILLKKITQEDIVLALNELDNRGQIKIGQRGAIQIIRKEDERTIANKKIKESGQFVFGRVDLTQSGTAFIVVDGMAKDVFVPKKFVRNAMQGDEVRVRIYAHGKRPEGEIVEIIHRSQDTFVGRLEILEKYAFFIADQQKLKQDVFVPLTALGGAKHNDRVIVRVTEWDSGTKNPVGEVLEVLKSDFSSDLDMKMILMENGFSPEFPKDVYHELDKVSEHISPAEIEKRLDYREILTITIDPEDAKDFDDAISYRVLENGHYEIGIHIADVSHYIKEGSALDREAERRATSVYLPDRVCPMLPEKLSNVLCSLRANEDKLTASVIVEFDQSYKIINTTIAKTVIHVNRRFSYEQAQQVIETGEGDFAEEMKVLLSISKSIREKRFAKGAIAFEKAEVRFKLDEQGKPVDVILKVRKDAHLLIEDFMLLANETIARAGSRLKHSKQPYPFVYRVHDVPDTAKLEQFAAIASRFGYKLRFNDPVQVSETLNNLLKKVEGRPEQNVLETLAIRSMAKAEYTTKNIGHYGLAMEYYTHFTSPIRRYPDVMVHRLIFDTADESSKIPDKMELEKRCKNSSLMERKAMDAERQATRYKQIEFLQDKIGNEYNGVISGVMMRGIFVEMDENKCEGFVHLEMMGHEDFVYDERLLLLKGVRSGKRYQIGDRVRVKVLSATIETRRVELGLIIE